MMFTNWVDFNFPEWDTHLLFPKWDTHPNGDTHLSFPKWDTHLLRLGHPPSKRDTHRLPVRSLPIQRQA